MGTRVLIAGEVQGIGFRWSAVTEAERIGVSGTIRNLPDGRVEAIVDGDGAGPDELIAWLRHGPPGAHVTGVDLQPCADTGESGFHITRG